MEGHIYPLLPIFQIRHLVRSEKFDIVGGKEVSSIIHKWKSFDDLPIRFRTRVYNGRWMRLVPFRIYLFDHEVIPPVLDRICAAAHQELHNFGPFWAKQLVFLEEDFVLLWRPLAVEKPWYKVVWVSVAALSCIAAWHLFCDQLPLLPTIEQCQLPQLVVFIWRELVALMLLLQLGHAKAYW